MMSNQAPQQAVNTKSVTDTQILSKSFKGASEQLPRNSTVASVTAKEFLLAQTHDSGKPSYYVLHPAVYSHLVEAHLISPSGYFGNAKWAKRGSHQTDQLIIDFGKDFPPYREYSDQALSLIINDNGRDVYKLSIAHLPKVTQKYLMDRFQYLVDIECCCLPVNKGIVEVGLELFAGFTDKYTCKDNFKNTVNDVLIFATAVEHCAQLRTEDILLARFAAEMYDAPISEHGNEVLVDFSHPKKQKRKLSRDSKGYVNRGWSYSIRNHRAVTATSSTTIASRTGTAFSIRPQPSGASSAKCSATTTVAATPWPESSRTRRPAVPGPARPIPPATATPAAASARTFSAP
jgi:hypothetical protein